MDPAAFDALSRSLGGGASRRSLLARLAAGLALLVHLPLRGDVTARKKRRRKRKRKRNRCPARLVRCNGQCGLPNLASGCLFGNLECCSKRCFANVCVPCPGTPCDTDDDCCDGLPCADTNDPNAGFTCGGCLHGPIGTCQSADDCCSAACNNGFCLSRLGETCATGFDCMGLPKGPVTCLGGTCVCARECCADADCPQPEQCRNGTCTCPTKCCFDTDCLPAEQCRSGECQPSTGG
jgi:hypothetical protein